MMLTIRVQCGVMVTKADIILTWIFYLRNTIYKIDRWNIHGNCLTGGNTTLLREYNYGIGNYEYGRNYNAHRILHGWFDGGHGAGLEDYWEKCGATR